MPLVQSEDLMPYSSLRDFITKLEKSGQLVRINEPISTVLEMTEIQTRLLAEGGPAVIFEKPTGADGQILEIPVLVNLFGTKERVAWAMEREPKDLRKLGEILSNLRQPTPPDSVSQMVKMAPILKSALSMRPVKKSGKAPCQEIILEGENINLNDLPIQTCWPGEPAPLITFPLIVTQGPGTKPEDSSNLGIYRMQVIDKNRTLMRWLKHRGGAQHHRRWKTEKLSPLPVAAVIGADPGTILAAVTPIPETLSEYQFAGLLRGKRVQLTDCISQPLQVPAEAEIVIEGTVSLDETLEEGPYGDHTGFYNSKEQFPIFTVTAITMRHNPIFLSTFTGRPPDEPSILGEALNEIFIPILQKQFPEIVDFWLPPEACSYRIAVVSINKEYPGHAKRVMMSIWSYLKQFLYTKWVIVVDDDINVRDWKDVMWAVSVNMDPGRDITIIENTPIDYLDFASPDSGLGSKIGLDATTKIGPETNRTWGRKIVMDEKIINIVTEKWPRLGLPGSGKSIWS